MPPFLDVFEDVVKGWACGLKKGEKTNRAELSLTYLSDFPGPPLKFLEPWLN